MDPPRGFARRLSSTINRLLRGPKPPRCSLGSSDPTLGAALHPTYENATTPSSGYSGCTNDTEESLSSLAPQRPLGHQGTVANHQEKIGGGGQYLYAEFIREYPGIYPSSCMVLIMYSPIIMQPPADQSIFRLGFSTSCETRNSPVWKERGKPTSTTWAALCTLKAL